MEKLSDKLNDIISNCNSLKELFKYWNTETNQISEFITHLETDIKEVKRIFNKYY